MAFVPPAGVNRATSAKTRQQIEQSNIMLELVDRSMEPEMRTMNRVYAQRRTFANQTPSNEGRQSKTDATGIARSWETPSPVAASEITVSLQNAEELAYSLPRLDVVQSPLNEVEGVRRALAAFISNEIERNMVTFFNSLTSSTTATDNGGAGGVSKKSLGKGGSIFIAPPADAFTKPATTGTGAGDLVMDAVNDFIMWAKVQNLIDGRAIYGDAPARLYMVIHPLLFKFYLVDALVAEGYSLDPLTAGALQNTQVFSGEAFTASLGLNRITILSPNSLVNAKNNTPWNFWGGYSEATVGGIGPILTQLISPQQNQMRDGWDIRQVVNPFYTLLNGDGIRQYSIAQK